jgi:hypothetical protein
MSPSHTNTAVGVGANPLSADDEDLDDICPVCDVECTCANRPKPRPAPSNSPIGNAQPAATTNNSSAALQPSVPTLKIKLTANMLSKVRAAQALSNSKKSRNLEETTYEIANDGEQLMVPPSSGQLGSSSVSSGSALRAPKRRGRPPKVARDPARSASLDHLVTSGNEANTLSSPSLSHPSRSLKPRDTQPRANGKSRAKPKGKGTTVKNGKAAAVARPTKKKTNALSEDDLGSELTDLDDQDIEDDYDGQSVQYPTFVSASALSTSTFSEDSDTASSADFDSDSSMEAEEENYILSEERRHEKARVRKELLGDGPKRKDPHNSWIIRPRKQSVGASDIEMDGDSDATEDEDDDEEGKDGGDEDELDEGNPGVTYAGVATGWSDEDEESSFDADLFFANLSGSSGDSQSSASEEEGDVDDHSDLNTEMTSPALHAARLQMDNLSFEVSQGWDGQIIFTNGLGEGQGILDLDFEVSAAQFVEDSASPSHDSDVEMQTSECDGEYEVMGEFGEEESDGGDTTDDDYVDKDGLPTKRMLELFHWPSSLSAIDPMSTVSPTVSPHPGNRRRNQRSIDSMSPHDSPRPADILAGKMFWDEPDEHDRSDVVASSVTSSSRGPPVMGKFQAGDCHPRKAILTGSNDNIPSPFPRPKHGNKSSSQSSIVSVPLRSAGGHVNYIDAVPWPCTFSTAFSVNIHFFLCIAGLVF